MNTAAAVAELPDDAVRCRACQVDMSSDLGSALSVAPNRRHASIAERWTAAPGLAVAVLVLAIGVGFLIPILCSMLAIGVGVVAIRSSDGRGKAAKRMAVASVVLGIVGIIGAIAVLVGA